MRTPLVRPRTAALLLALLGPAAVTPLAALDMLWLGPQMIVAGLEGGDLVFAILGLVTLLGGLVPFACVGLAAALARGRRRARVGGAVLAVGIALAGLTPLLSLSPLSWVPGGRFLLIAFALGTALALLWTEPVAVPVPRPLRLLPTACAAAALLLATAGAAAGLTGNGIPGAPSGLLAGDFSGGERLRGAPLAAGPTPPPLGLMRGQGSNIHNDAAMSDVYRGRHVLDPRDAAVRSFLAPGDCASILFGSDGRPIAVCVGATETNAFVLDPETLEPLAEHHIADREIGPDFATNFAGGGYAALDAHGRLVVPGADGEISRYQVYGGPDPAIEPLDSFEVQDALGDDEPITSALPGSDAWIWFVGADGTVGLLDTESGRAQSLRFEGTEIENSFALAPDGDAYVVTSQELIRLTPGPGGRPRIVWSEPYEAGTRRKPGQTSRASGTTPTVMLGGRFVAIADNAEPRLNVLVFDARERARGERLVCEVPVFGEDESATENSLIAAGRAIFVENNYGYRLFDVLGGHSTEPGAARIDLAGNGRSCAPRWENDEIRIPSAVSKVSAADGTMLTYTKSPSVAGVDAWYFTALDAVSGEVLWKRKAGAGALANNHYAALYVGPGGELYVGTTGGVIGLVEASEADG